MWLTLPRLVRALSVFPVFFVCATGRATAQNPAVITAPELARSGAANVYDAIRRLRPEMLRSRGSGTLIYFATRTPMVVVDTKPVGSVEALRSMDIEHVASIESVSPWQAAKRYGRTFGDGLILMTQRAGSNEFAHRADSAVVSRASPVRDSSR